MRKITIIVSICYLTSLLLLSSTIHSISLNKKELNTSHIDLLIITSKPYQEACTELINHKNNMGIETILTITDTIFNEFQGKDKQEQIKYCIKKAYDTFHISSVLLIGDHIDIPVRYCYNNDEFDSFKEPCFISDLYYADLYDEQGMFSTWNTDHDEYYGEWDGDYAEDANISLIPEVSIGRLPCSNRFQLYTIIHKIVHYESKTKCDEWFQRFVVAGGDTYSAARGYNGDQYGLFEGEELNKKAMSIMKDFDAVPLWASTDTLSTRSLIKAINNGCGFLYLSGHGSPGIWNTHPYNSSETIGNLPNIVLSLLRNRNRLPVCIVGGCHNSQFDVHPSRLLSDPFFYATWHRNCWSWKLISNPWGGSIATIGCTGLSWHGKEFGGGGIDWLNLHFFKEYANGENTIGTIWKNAITTYLQAFPINWETPSGNTSSIDAKTVQEWILFGDPTLEIKR